MNTRRQPVGISVPRIENPEAYVRRTRFGWEWKVTGYIGQSRRPLRGWCFTKGRAERLAMRELGFLRNLRAGWDRPPTPWQRVDLEES